MSAETRRCADTYVCDRPWCRNDITELRAGAKTKKPTTCTEAACEREQHRREEEERRARAANTIAIEVEERDGGRPIKPKRSESRDSPAFTGGTPGNWGPIYEEQLRLEGWFPERYPPSGPAYKAETTFETIEEARRRDDERTGELPVEEWRPVNRLLGTAAMRLRDADVEPNFGKGTRKRGRVVGSDRPLGEDDFSGELFKRGRPALAEKQAEESKRAAYRLAERNDAAGEHLPGRQWGDPFRVWRSPPPELLRRRRRERERAKVVSIVAVQTSEWKAGAA